jgi:rubrerythrin
MSEGSTQDQAIHSLPELLAHALAMETDAADRYGELADQMELHRRTAVADIFRRLEKAEQKHLDELNEMCAGMDLPHIAPWDFKWSGAESPEAIAIDKVSYHLTVKGAVLLALDHEQQAQAFYSRIAGSTTDAEVRRLATQFAEEERQHVTWLETWRDQCGPDDEVPLDDPDPPLSQE